MKLILDTNIWYEIETNPVFFDKTLEKAITVTYLNYFELIKSSKIIKNPELMRLIFNAMDKYEKIFEPPFVHMARMHEYYHYNILTELHDQVIFLLNFKKGDFIYPAKEEDFLEYIASIKSDFQEYVDLFNLEAKNIKGKIKSLKKHRERDSLKDTSDFIQFMIENAVKRDLKNFDFNKIQLLTETLNVFFKQMEVGEIIMNANDVSDFLMMSYVQPGDKYYTKDKKWIKLITASGNTDYMYMNYT